MNSASLTGGGSTLLPLASIILPSDQALEPQRSRIRWCSPKVRRSGSMARRYPGKNGASGLALIIVNYDGRSLFYRLSLAEMFVPYGDPRAPYPRKAAFDLGNDGAGINANNLRLGCDCLGT
jgi:Cu2+-containing amine oxidase